VIFRTLSLQGVVALKVLSTGRCRTDVAEVEYSAPEPKAATSRRTAKRRWVAVWAFAHGQL